MHPDNNSQCWLHFIGVQYYSISEFVKEAEQIGISRAVSPQVLKKMNLGDFVVLAQKDGPSTKIFGYFRISVITGLTPEAISLLKEKNLIQRQSTLVPMRIKRGCGTYEIIGSYSITDPDVIMDTIKEMSSEMIGRVMIGGEFVSLSEVITGVKDYVLTDIPFRQGFRLFDYQGFQDAVHTSKNRKVKGQFYSAEKDQHYINLPIRGELLEIQNYQLN